MSDEKKLLDARILLAEHNLQNLITQQARQLEAMQNNLAALKAKREAMGE